MQLLRSRRFPSGAMITTEGEAVIGMFFIVSGEVEISRGETTEVLENGDFFGEGCLLAERHNLTARAVTEVDLLLLEREDFERLLRQSPELDEHIRALSHEVQFKD